MDNINKDQIAAGIIGGVTTLVGIYAWKKLTSSSIMEQKEQKDHSDHGHGPLFDYTCQGANWNINREYLA
jgi:hypothetical protein